MALLVIGKGVIYDICKAIVTVSRRFLLTIFNTISPTSHRCLHQYKDDLRRKAEERRRSEARRRKEAEALQSSSGASSSVASVLATIVAAVVASSKISW